jgi:hypothetical protein
MYLQGSTARASQLMLAVGTQALVSSEWSSAPSRTLYDVSSLYIVDLDTMKVGCRLQGVPPRSMDLSENNYRLVRGGTGT